MFTRLARYKKQAGDCNVPDKWEEVPQLATWIRNQRHRKKSSVSADHIQRLNALGFEWDPLIAAWEEMFARLGQYKERVGNCNVPARWPEDPRLAHWVDVLRRNRKRGVLSDGRIQRLDALGFEWDPLAAAWEEMFSCFVQFKERHGHCNVPDKWRENAQLGSWVKLQRHLRKRNRLSADRLPRLNTLGFEWDPLITAWEEMFTRLARYKKQVGHCNVPHSWEEDPATWQMGAQTTDC